MKIYSATKFRGGFYDNRVFTTSMREGAIMLDSAESVPQVTPSGAVAKLQPIEAMRTV